jgi:hypothetical protein
LAGLTRKGFPLIDNIIGDNKMTKDELNNFVLGDVLYAKYNNDQVIEFKAFCDKHDIGFNTISEYRSAIAQYYNGE